MENSIKNKLQMKKKIEEKIAKYEDIFGRKIELKKISINEEHPYFIQKNQNILKDWIL